MRILIVDDSSFFRRLLKEILSRAPGFEVVGEARCGEEAIAMAAELKPDVITMDVEMPGIDGISATREIMKARPTPIIMLSSLTQHGAQATFDALEAGAVDFMPKLDKVGGGLLLQQAPLLLTKLRLVVASRRHLRSPAPIAPAPVARPVPVATGTTVPVRTSGKGERFLSVRGMVVIGASTGGPAAVQTVLQALPASFGVPIFVLLHMPALFTKIYAERLHRAISLTVKEAEADETPLAGHVYIAPGGGHTELVMRHGKPVFQMREARESEHFRPSVDIGLGSAASIYRADALGIVLTGMGNDGVLGARALKAAGGHVWTQDKDSCVIYGMPMEVEKAGLSDAVMPLGELASSLLRSLR